MNNTFFKILGILSVCFICNYSVVAQVNHNKDNIIKINVPALILKNISIQYEKKIGTKNSLAVAIRYRPKSSIPFQSIVEKFIDQPSVRVDLFKIGNFAITPEYRFYLSRKKDLQGFYVAPFLSYNHYNSDIPVNYYNDEKTGVFVGSMNSFTGGVQIGAQWKLSEKVYLDWWIIGPNYGKSKGDFVCTTPLNDTEQISMDFELFRIQEGTDPRIIKSYNVNADGASFKVDGPWGGIRAMGINIGYRF